MCSPLLINRQGLDWRAFIAPNVLIITDACATVSFMRKSLVYPLAIASLILAACGGDKDEHVIEVNEEKFAEAHPENNTSGTVLTAPRNFAIQFNAPSPAWTVKIESVWTVGVQNWIIARMSESEEPAAQVVTKVSDVVKVYAPELPVVYYVMGEPDGWTSKNPNLVYIDSLDEIQEGLNAGSQIWPELKE
ncbi:MAG: hypothetical protein AAFX93_02825 [Verrucomicrobiota bacterium]